MRGKKGVSGVIAVVLLLLLTIVAIGVIAGVLIPFVKDNLNESSRCNDVLTGITIIPDKSCYKIIEDETTVTIGFGDVDPEGIYIVYEDDSGTTQRVDYLEGDLPSSGGGQKSYIQAGVFETVGVGAFASGKQCAFNDQIKLKRC